MSKRKKTLIVGYGRLNLNINLNWWWKVGWKPAGRCFSFGFGSISWSFPKTTPPIFRIDN